MSALLALGTLAPAARAIIGDGKGEAPPTDAEAAQIWQRIQERLKSGKVGKMDPKLLDMLSEMEGQLAEADKRTNAAVAELWNLQKEYETAEDRDKLQTRREALRAVLYQESSNLAKLESDSRDSSWSFMVGALADVASGFHEGHMPKQASQNVTFGLRGERFRQGLRALNSRIGNWLTDDDAAYRLALKARESRRQLRSLEFGAGAGLLALLGMALWLWRRRLGAALARVPAPAMLGLETLAPSVVLGSNYQVERELGRGSMGVVVKATDLTLKRPVALKMLRQFARGRPEAVDQFLKEAQLVAGLTHPNIVQIHTAFKEGDDIFLVFEYVAGRPLSDVLVDFQRLPLPDVKKVVRQVAEALDFAHGRRIIHRDLKPSNIMIDSEGTAKVMDFGLAHQAKLTAARFTHVSTWGSPAYMAPEQELGTVSVYSDIYALGVCLYEMLTGETPFPGPNQLAQKQQMLFSLPSKVITGLSSAADAVLQRVFSAKPEDRYPNARLLAEAVESIPDGA